MLSDMIKEYTGQMVYHGSNTLVEVPDLRKAKALKDFGAGFYTTSSKSQAQRFANIICERTGSKTPCVTAYRLKSLEDLNVKIFAETNPPNRDWLQMIIDCRKKGIAHNFDVVVGAIADDQTSTVIRALLGGLYGDPYGYEAQMFAITQFESQKLKDQLVFCTEQALTRLVFVEAIK